MHLFHTWILVKVSKIACFHGRLCEFFFPKDYFLILSRGDVWHLIQWLKSLHYSVTINLHQNTEQLIQSPPVICAL